MKTNKYTRVTGLRNNVHYKILRFLISGKILVTEKMYSMFLWLIFRLSQQILRVILGGSMLHVIITVRICIHTSIAFQSVFSRLTPKAMEESSSWMMMMMKMIIMMLQFY